MKKKVVALMLGTAMVMSLLSGCGDKAEKESSVAEESKKSEQPASSETKSEEKSEESSEESSVEEIDISEPIVLSLGYYTGNIAAGDGIHTEKNAALQYIKEKFNIEIEYVAYDEEKFNMWVAGNDMPDIMINQNFGNSNVELIESGVYVEVSELYEKYGQNILKNCKDALEAQKTQYGGYYGPPAQGSAPADPVNNTSEGFLYRYDIYKAIGSPTITDEDSLLEVLKQMQDYQREQLGRDDVYVYAYYTDGGSWCYRYPYVRERGWDHVAPGNYSVNVKTGEFQSNFMDEDSVYWDGVRYMNKAYRMGIVDPDSFIQDSSTYGSKLSSGRILASITGAQPNTDVCGENAIMTVLPTQEEGKYIVNHMGSYSPMGWGFHAARVITSNCEYPERAVMLLDWFETVEGARTLLYGPQGTGWDIIDGVPQLTPAAKEAYANGTTSEFFRDISMRDYGEWLLWSCMVTSDDGAAVKLDASRQFRAENASVARKSFAADFGFDYVGEVYESWVNEGMYGDTYPGVEYSRLVYGNNYSWPAEVQELQYEAENYFCANVSKLVMAKDDEEFNKEKQNMIDYFTEIGCAEQNEMIMDILTNQK